MKAGMSMDEDAFYSVLANRETITATADISPHLLSLPPVADRDVVTAGLLMRPLRTEHDTFVVEHAAVDRTSSTDVKVPSSSSPTLVLNDILPIGALLPFGGSAVAQS